MTSAKAHGKNGVVYIGGRNIGKTQWEFDMAREYVDATAFGDTTKTYLVWDKNGLSVSAHTPQFILGDACIGCGCCPPADDHYYCRQCLAHHP